jgi:uncharacterized protein
MDSKPIEAKVGIIKEDGWINALTGAGLKSRDKFENSSFYLQQMLTDEEVSDIYRGDGIGKKIIDIPAKDMVRPGFSVEGDTDNAIFKYLSRLKLQSTLKSAIRWSRLFGGSMIIMGIDDGTKVRTNEQRKYLELPLRENNIKKIGFFQVYDRRQITWYATDIDQDPSSENYGKPKRYRITPVNANPTFLPFYVHHSRCLRFIGEELPQRESLQRYGWGDSALQSVYTRIRGFASSLLATEAILDEFVVGILTIKNLQDLVSGGREQELVKRLNQIDMSRHVLNTMLVDKEEDYRRLSATVNGIKDILEFLKDCLSAVSGIPQVKLFGEQSKGIGSSASGNIRMYYDDIAEMQQEDMRQQLERLVDLTIRSEDFRKVKKIDSNWQLKFNSLWQMDETTLATSRHLIAKSDEIYMKNGALKPSTVAKSRFGGDSYSPETTVSTEELAEIEKGLIPITSKPVQSKGKNGTGKPEDNSNSSESM